MREQVCVLHRVGFQKLISMIGRFDTYKGGVYRMDSLMNPSSDMSDMFLVTGGKGGVCACFFFLHRHNHKHTHTHRSSNQLVAQEERLHEAQLLVKD